MSSFIMQANTRRWMQELHPVNSKAIHYFLGVLKNAPNTEVIAEHPKGHSRFYCTLHNFVYPIKGSCDLCLAEGPKEGSPQVLQTGSTPL